MRPVLAASRGPAARSTTRRSTAPSGHSGWLGMAISAVLAVFDRKGIDGAVDGLGDVSRARPARACAAIQTGNVQTYLMLLVAGHRRARGGVRTMSGLPVLSIITFAPLVAALLIAVFGRSPKVPRWIALGAGDDLPRERRVGVRDLRSRRGRPAVRRVRAVDPVDRRLVHASASTASRYRCSCSWGW